MPTISLTTGDTSALLISICINFVISDGDLAKLRRERNTILNTLREQVCAKTSHPNVKMDGDDDILAHFS